MLFSSNCVSIVGLKVTIEKCYKDWTSKVCFLNVNCIVKEIFCVWTVNLVEMVQRGADLHSNLNKIDRSLQKMCFTLKGPVPYSTVASSHMTHEKHESKYLY